MRVLFLIPNWNEYTKKMTTVTLNPPKVQPLLFYYVVEKLKNTDVEAIILDANKHQLNYKNTLAFILKSQVDLVVFSTTVNDIFWRCPPLDLDLPTKIVGDLSEHGIQSLLVGPHGTVSPELTLQKTKADFLIRGEFEIALVQFLTGVCEKTEIDGLCWNGHVQSIATVKDINELNISNCEIYEDGYMSHYWKNPLREEFQPSAIVEFSRGCPFNCPFCLRNGFREHYRKKNPEVILQELKILKEKGFKYVFFIDEIFNFPSEDLKILLIEMKHLNLKFGCQCRLDVGNREILELMKEAGCVHIEYGLESSDKAVLTKIDKNCNFEKISEVLKATYDIFEKDVIEMSYINFYTEDIAELIHLETDGIPNPSSWSSKQVRPYPGTDFGKQLYDKYNKIDNEWDFALKFTWFLQIEYLYKVKNAQQHYSTSLEDIKNHIIDQPLSLSEPYCYDWITKLKDLSK